MRAIGKSEGDDASPPTKPKPSTRQKPTIISTRPEPGGGKPAPGRPPSKPPVPAAHPVTVRPSPPRPGVGPGRPGRPPSKVLVEESREDGDGSASPDTPSTKAVASSVVGDEETLATRGDSTPPPPRPVGRPAPPPSRPVGGPARSKPAKPAPAVSNSEPTTATPENRGVEELENTSPGPPPPERSSASAEAVIQHKDEQDKEEASDGPEPPQRTAASAEAVAKDRPQPLPSRPGPPPGSRPSRPPAGARPAPPAKDGGGEGVKPSKPSLPPSRPVPIVGHQPVQAGTSSSPSVRPPPAGKPSKPPSRPGTGPKPPAAATDKESELSKKPSKPSPPTGRPTPPVGKPAPPVGKPAPPVGKPAPPVGKPAPPVGKPAPPVGKPAPPAGKPAPPVEKPAPPASKPDRPRAMTVGSRPPPPQSKPGESEKDNEAVSKEEADLVTAAGRPSKPATRPTIIPKSAETKLAPSAKPSKPSTQPPPAAKPAKVLKPQLSTEDSTVVPDESESAGDRLVTGQEDQEEGTSDTAVNEVTAEDALPPETQAVAEPEQSEEGKEEQEFDGAEEESSVTPTTKPAKPSERPKVGRPAVAPSKPPAPSGTRPPPPKASPSKPAQPPNRPSPMKPAAPSTRPQPRGSVRQSYRSQLEEESPPPLPPRPGPGHPLFHYACTSPHGICLYDYSSSQPDELDMVKGDVIVLLERIDENWLMGRNIDIEGMFPEKMIKTVKKLPEDVQMASGPSCVAMFEFIAEADDELSFKKGDLIVLLEHVGAEWLKGRLGKDVGVFPREFVEILEDLPEGATSEATSTSLPDEPSCEAVFDFEGQDSAELSFTTGQIIRLTGRVNDEWLQGELDGHKGMFPLEFVKILVDLPVDSGDAPSSDETKSPSDKETPSCKAMYDYSAGADDELTFKTDDVIELTGRVDEEWLRGRLHGKEGIFPQAFVEILHDFPKDASASKKEDQEKKKEEQETKKEEEEKKKEKQESEDEVRLSKVGKLSEDLSPRAEAEYDFDAENPDELTFKVGDVIYLLNRVDGEWMEGECNGSVGKFPIAFVKVIMPLP